MNLTAITEFDDVMKKHFADSLSLVKAYSEIRTEKLKVIDIGTGAGFPGIPLKIVFPQIELTLLDSLQKRLKFLQEVIDQLGLGEMCIRDRIRSQRSRRRFRIRVSGSSA